MAPSADHESSARRSDGNARDRTRPQPHDDDDATTSLGADSATEGTPLLANDLPTEVLPSNGFQIRVIATCVAFLVILEFSAFIMEAPSQQLQEDILCYRRYRDHVIGAPDERCKNQDVQNDLTLYKSSMSFVSTLFPLIVQIPFGIVADHYGRRPVLLLGIFIGAVNVTFGFLPLAIPDKISIWATIPFSVTLLFGGGAVTTGAMIWTILSDVVPVANRASVFYQLSAVMVIFSALFFPLSAWLMRITPWLPVWIGLLFMYLGVLLGVFIPETNGLRAAADKVQAQQEDEGRTQQDEQSTANSSEEDNAASSAKPGVLQLTWATVKHDGLRIWRFVFGSPQIMILITAQAFMAPLGLAVLIYGLQYMTRRFKWDWSAATYISTIPRTVSVVVLLLVLPLLSKLATDCFKMNPLKRDLQFARVSITSMAVGMLLHGLASTPAMLIVGMIFEAASLGFPSQLRALVTAVVEPHMIATVNTTISTTESILTLAGLPFIGWLLTVGFEIGEPWLGLPFLVLSGFSFCILAILAFYRIPKEQARIEGHA